METEKGVTLYLDLFYSHIYIMSNFIMEGEHIGLLKRTRGNESKLQREYVEILYDMTLWALVPVNIHSVSLLHF